MPSLTAAEIDDEIIAPALWLIGDLWERGQISVADEHIATEITILGAGLVRARRTESPRPWAITGSCSPPQPMSNTSLRCAWSMTSSATPATTS